MGLWYLLKLSYNAASTLFAFYDNVAESRLGVVFLGLLLTVTDTGPFSQRAFVRS